MSNPHYRNRAQLCVQPTDRESQFEAFQSIIASIMNANDDSPFQLLLQSKDIKLYKSTSSSSKKDGIYFKPPVRGSTHYYAIKDGEKLDPYEYYQPKGTQGFCQLFAYFLYIDEPGFTKVDMTGKAKVGIEEFDDYAENTLLCLKKFIEIIKSNQDIYDRFKAEFLTLRDDPKFGIKAVTRFKTFLDHCERLDIIDAKYYIYDNPLKGYTSKEGSKDQLWFSFN